MTLKEFFLWQEYYVREPFGAYRDDIHQANIVSTLINMNTKKGARHIPITDCQVIRPYIPPKHNTKKLREQIIKIVEQQERK